MSIYKIPLPLNILEAAKERITWTLNTLPRVCVSFSGGKDSGLMLHLTAEIARQMGKKICVLFIDWEAQFSCTINYVQSLREFYADVIEEFYWVALPLTTQNSLSQYQPEWKCWEPDVEWVRQPPQDAITDPDFFSFYQPGMTFEQFVREFAEWFSQKRPAAMILDGCSHNFSCCRVNRDLTGCVKSVSMDDRLGIWSDGCRCLVCMYCLHNKNLLS